MHTLRSVGQLARGGAGARHAAIIAAGGNIDYLAKPAGIFGLSVQDIGAQQTGLSVAGFKAILRAHGCN